MDEDCHLSLDEHIDWLFQALEDAGIGGNCINSFRAMAEIAEASRIANNFAPYEPVLAAGLAAEAMMLGHDDGIMN